MIDIQKLQADLQQLTGTVPAHQRLAILRALHDDIEDRLAAGATHEDVVKVLQAHGLDIKVPRFRYDLQTLRREKGMPPRASRRGRPPRERRPQDLKGAELGNALNALAKPAPVDGRQSVRDARNTPVDLDRFKR